MGDGPSPILSFLILQYVEGHKLAYSDVKGLSEEQRACLFTSLADIYIQLRRLEFSAIGCLVRAGGSYQVGKRANSIELNMQALEGLSSSAIQGIDYNAGAGTLTWANGHVAMLLHIADNAFAKGPGAPSREEAEDDLYHLHIFRQYAQDWVDNRLDSGPFVLVHGDLEIFNLILDDDGNIISVLDWEWSRVDRFNSSNHHCGSA